MSMLKEDFNEKETTKRGEVFVDEVIGSIQTIDPIIKITKSDRNTDMYDHIDLIMTVKDLFTLTYDVKARKGCGSLNLKRIDDDHIEFINDYTIVELANVRGNNGWIDGKAYGIIFERYDKIIMVNRIELRDMIDKKLDLTYVKNLDEAIYKIYTRNGKDIMTVVPFEDILQLSSVIILDNLLINQRI